MPTEQHELNGAASSRVRHIVHRAMCPSQSGTGQCVLYRAVCPTQSCMSRAELHRVACVAQTGLCYIEQRVQLKSYTEWHV